MAIIETHQLTKTYNSLKAVDSLDIAVESGEIFGLLGPNGAGKQPPYPCFARFLSQPLVRQQLMVLI